MILPRAVLLDLVREAARAPSVHNVQPARWRFLDSGEVRLYRTVARALPAADPTGRDVLQSLGAAFEGLALALTRREVGLSAPVLVASNDGTAPDGHEEVASARLVAGAERAELADYVLRRRSFRGRFDPASAEELQTLRKRFADAPDARLIVDVDGIHDVARRYDRASFGFLSQAPYLREFFSWCRFHRSHPDWNRDGLNADCLALSEVERIAASFLLRPAVFQVLKRLGVARPAISEAAQIRSSSAILLYCPRADANPFDVGRRFYRLWLEVTAAGFSACPLSAVADDRNEAASLERTQGLASDRRILNVFRLGVVRRASVPESPRIPAEELLV